MLGNPFLSIVNPKMLIVASGSLDTYSCILKIKGETRMKMAIKDSRRILLRALLLFSVVGFFIIW